MDYKITPYINKVFNADILSYLNVDSEGDVVSAKTWKALWGNILNFTQQIDVHMTELLSPNGVVTMLIADHNRFIEEHALILADYNILKQKFAVLDDVITEADANVQQALQAAQIAHDAAVALGTEFIHYGDTPPTNPYTKLWARKTDPTDLPASLADVMMRVPKVYNGNLGAPYSSVLAINNYDPTSDGKFPSDSAYKYIGVHDIDYNGRGVESAHGYTGMIPTRGAGGNLWTGMPIDDSDCVPKKYVDDALENVGGGGNVDLTDYVKNIDYATATKGGVIKLNAQYCVRDIGNGVLASVTRTYEQYTSLGNYAFISKGTLDNVLAEKIGDIETLLGGI